MDQPPLQDLIRGHCCSRATRKANETACRARRDAWTYSELPAEFNLRFPFGARGALAARAFVVHRHGLPGLPTDAVGEWRPYLENLCANLNGLPGLRTAQLAACDDDAALCDRKGAARHEITGPAYWGTTEAAWTVSPLAPPTENAVAFIHDRIRTHLLPY